MRDSSLAAGTIASLLVVRFRFTLSRASRWVLGSGVAVRVERVKDEG